MYFENSLGVIEQHNKIIIKTMFVCLEKYLK